MSSSVREWLEFQQDIVILRTNAGVAWSKSEPGEPQRMIKLGRKGTADLTLCVVGAFVAIELKVQGNTLTDDQEAYREEVLRCGGIHSVCRSINEVVDLVERIREYSPVLKTAIQEINHSHGRL